MPKEKFKGKSKGLRPNPAGFGLSPFDFPLNFSLGISDITDNSTNGAQFNINTGYSFRF